MDDPIVDADGHAGFWINTEPTIDGTAYVVTLSLSEDFAVTLTPVRAQVYAFALLSACAQAEYDAAVYNQLRDRLKVPHDLASAAVLQMRADRLPLDAGGVRFTPGVSARKQHPFVQFHRGPTELGQMDVPSARRHALHVLEAPAAADLDGLYYRVLRSWADVDEETAREAVTAVADHREPWTVADE